MSEKVELTRETFMGMAEAAGLDVSDKAHMEEMYTLVEALLPGLEAVRSLDLGEEEPASVFVPPVQ